MRPIRISKPSREKGVRASCLVSIWGLRLIGIATLLAALSRKLVFTGRQRPSRILPLLNDPDFLFGKGRLRRQCCARLEIGCGVAAGPDNLLGYTVTGDITRCLPGEKL
jgi:hypothetical protein